MYCTKCGADIRDNAKFCPKCGAVISMKTDSLNQTNNVDGRVVPEGTTSKIDVKNNLSETKDKALKKEKKTHQKNGKTGKFNIKKLIVPVIIIVALVVIGIVVFPIIMKNSDVRKFEKYLSDADFKSAYSLIDGDPSLEYKLNTAIETAVEAYYSDYLSENLSYDDAVNKIKNIGSYGYKTDQVIDKVNAINTGRDNLASADRLFASGDYDQAMSLYKCVTSEDTKYYVYCLTQINLCITNDYNSRISELEENQKLPTPMPTATNTPAPTPTATNTPTPEPTVTDTPVLEPTDDPALEPTATDTPTPALTATNIPTPSLEHVHSLDEDYNCECGYSAASKGLTYKLHELGTYYIVTGIGSFTGTELIIPTEYNGKPVKEIASSAFKGCSKLMKVVIPSTVKSIGSYAFQQNISLTEIEYNAKNCADITSYSSDAPFKGAGSDHDNGLKITIGSAVTRIPKGLFLESAATKLVFMGSQVTEIASYAFCNCTKLTDASIPSSVSTIGKYAFENCPFYK